MTVDVALSLIVSAGICLIGWRLKIIWRCMLLGSFLLFAANIDPRADLLIYLGLLSWGLLGIAKSGCPLGLWTVCFILLAVFGTLVKANFLFVAGLSATAISADLIFRHHFRETLVFILAIIVAFLLGWVISGQHVSYLLPFFANSLRIIRGYDQAVGLDALDTFRWRGLLVGALAISALVVRVRPDVSIEAVSVRITQSRGVCLFIWLGLFLFAVWKHGFVRADLYHMGFWFGFAPILALALELFPCASSRARVSARILALACSLMVLLTLGSLFFSSFSATLLQPFRALSTNVEALARPAQYAKQMSQKYEMARQAMELPTLREIIGRSSVDVFGQEQCYAVFNDLNYSPRPVFQSYMAYNPALMTLNEEFYLSKRAPLYVLFKLSSIDHKFPPLEDAKTLRHLLLNYQSISAEGSFLLLKAKTSKAPTLKLLREGTAAVGECVKLDDSNEAMIWMEIHLEPSVQGQLRQLIYKSPKVRLSVWSDSEKAPLARAVAPAPMLAAGFLLSPLLLQTKDVQNFYNHKDVIHPKRCSIEAEKGTESFWRAQLHFRIYGIDYHATPRSSAPEAALPSLSIPPSDDV
jgi:hypothetical protein